MVKINGDEKNADGMTIGEYLKATDFNIAKIAVERNGNIVPKAQYDSVVLCSGDIVEIVAFVGGG